MLYPIVLGGSLAYKGALSFITNLIVSSNMFCQSLFDEGDVGMGEGGGGMSGHDILCTKL